MRKAGNVASEGARDLVEGVGTRLKSAGVDTDKARVLAIAAYDLAMQHPGRAVVTGIARAAGQLVGRVQAEGTAAHEVIAYGFRHVRLPAPRGCGATGVASRRPPAY